MSDPRLRRLAEVVVGYSTSVRPGDVIRIEGGRPSTPLVREIYRAAVRAGGHPTAELVIQETAEDLMLDGTEAQLEWVPLDVRWTVEHGDVLIAIEAPENTKYLSGVEPARMARRVKGRERYQELALHRFARGDFRWVLCGYPTEASAQDGGMSLAQFEQVLYRAAFLEADDPVAAWRAFGERLDRIGSLLESKSELRVVAEDTDLRLGVGGRSWVRANGKANLPDGEVFTGPIETSVDGTIRFSFPAMVRGRSADGVVLRFEAGEVVEAEARRGEEFLREMIGVDAGARRVGEFAFGLNEEVRDYTGSLLLDEKIGGTVHLALGRSVPQTGGENISALHWDMVCDLRDGGEVYADGEVVYRDGAFVNGAG
jgi:aminopeptidase